MHQERQIHRIDPPRLKGPVVDHRRNRVPHRIGDDAVNLRIARDLLDAVQIPQLAGGHLPGRSAFRRIGRGIGVQAAENRRKNARGEPGLTHRQQHGVRLRIGPREFQHLAVVGGLLGGGDDLVAVGRNPLQAPHDGIGGGRPSVVVVGDQQVRVRPQRFHAFSRHFRAFDFDVHRLGARRDRQFENLDLFLDAAVEAAHILVAAAGGQDGAVGVPRQKSADGRDPLLGLGQVIQTKFEEPLARVVLADGVRQERLGFGKSEGDTNPGERSPRWHRSQNSITRCKRLRSSADAARDLEQAQTA